jgi:hypothetical protein
LSSCWWWWCALCTQAPCRPKTKRGIYLLLISCWKWKSLIHSEKDGWFFVTEKFPLLNICWEMKEGRKEGRKDFIHLSQSKQKDVCVFWCGHNHPPNHDRPLGGVSVTTAH